MPYPMTWSSGLTISGSNWNELRTYKNHDYVVFKEGSLYYAHGQYSGSTDYSGSDLKTILQNAIDAKSISSIFITGDGTDWHLTGSVALIVGSHTIIGSGIYQTRLVMSGSHNPIFKIKNDYNYISNMTLKSNEGNPTGSLITLQTANTRYTKIENCLFTGSKYGIYMGGANIYYTSILNNMFTYQENSGSSIYLTGLYHIIINNQLLNISKDSNNKAYGIHVVNADNTLISNNTINNVDGIGIYATQTATTPTCHIANNFIYSCDAGGIFVYGNGLHIVGNRLVDNCAAGGHELVLSGSFNSIIGNNIYQYNDNNRACIMVESGSYNALYSNALVTKYASGSYIIDSGSNTTSGSNPQMLYA